MTFGRKPIGRRFLMALILVTLWLILTLAPSTGAAASAVGTTDPLLGPVEGAPVRNYGIVEQGILSRSGKLTPEDYTWVRQQGVKGIVDFNHEDVDVEESFLKELGFTSYFRLSLHGPPSDAQADRFLTFVQDSRNWPLHVHCYAGEDRTGIMVALFRYAIDGWPLEKALEEAKLYRAGQDLYPDYVEWLKRWAESHPPGSHQPLGMELRRANEAR
jgi:hypothetical protein